MNVCECGHHIDEHSNGMRCRTCARDCGVRCVWHTRQKGDDAERYARERWPNLMAAYDETQPTEGDDE